MLFFGHIAIAVAAARRTDGDEAAAIAGNLLPDVVDKTGALLGLTPGRWLAHGLPLFTLSLLLARRWLDERKWRGFALGYTLHLVADLWAGGRVPWFAPLEPMPRRRLRPSRRQQVLYYLPEFVGVAYLLRRRVVNGARSHPAPWHRGGPAESPPH